ncbi:metal-dependent hydrolase [Patescibacteria group bacterium]|nr:metal-dependent hydrolase [Patescibacteria group bacterium]MBU1673403.1 metal-dependent hydrolase [Patescibacteria group bacterium]MBU1963307.1 metal-dependent hydrolase [Patescibacteria group bacterium]
MLFAHGPAGFLTAYFTRKIWKADKLPRRTQIWMYVVGFIGGLFPDIDLFYYYLGSARISHRQLFTHSLITYTLIFLIIFLIGSLTKKQSIKSLGIVFYFANISHLVLDMVYGATALFAPLSPELIGLPRLEFLYGTFFANNGVLVNFIFETLIVAIFFIVLAPIIFKKEKIVRLVRSIIVGAWIGVIFILIFINSNVMTIDTTRYYVNDHYDRDGDNIINIEDPDLDGNGISNKDDLLRIANEAEGNWYDPTNGGLLEIPYRMGLHNDISFIITVFLNMGINLDDEMKVDYYVYSDRYETTPEDASFNRNTGNLRAWLENKGRLLTSDSEIKTGDVIFLTSGQVALALDQNEIILADKEENKIIKKPLHLEEIQNIGRVLNIEE